MTQRISQIGIAPSGPALAGYAPIGRTCRAPLHQIRPHLTRISMKANRGVQWPESASPRIVSNSDRRWEELARLALLPLGAAVASPHELLERLALLTDNHRTGGGRFAGIPSPPAEGAMTDEARRSTGASGQPRDRFSGRPHRWNPDREALPTACAEFD